MITSSVLKISNNDNVAVALSDLKKGEKHLDIVLIDDIARGHKFALSDIKIATNIIKYGFPIGHATKDIKAGEHVHTQNTKTNLNENMAYQYNPVKVDLKKSKSRKVNLYKRKNGDFGIRNDLWIVPTVGCVNYQARIIADEFNKNSTSVRAIAYNHPYGCSQTGDDHENTRKTLKNITLHPNAGAVLVLGLGCENNQISTFREFLGDFDDSRIKFLVCQDSEDEVKDGVNILNDLAKIIANDKREEQDFSVLKIGLKCGGSDGLSGITANPLLGRFSDYLVSVGGTAALTEVPEMFGAEQLLMERAQNKEVFEQIVKLVNDFKDYFRFHGQEIYENPSPGNKAGGITTLEDKSLGCTQKGGNSIVKDVLFDGDIIKNKGLNLISGPGNDMVACTNLGAAGCQLVLFTTGRGTPFGGFVPTIKVATNSQIAKHKSNWIDFDAEKVLSQGFDKTLDEFIDFIVDVVNGQETKNEKLGIKDIAIFKSGVTL